MSTATAGGRRPVDRPHGRGCTQGTVAGAVEAAFAALAIRDQIAPPPINLDNPSVETAIDLVPRQAKAKEINVALSNSFGFGGTNASLVFRRHDR